MRFLAELSGNEFSYGDDFVSKTNDYDLVFANYDTEYITRMGGSYELNSVIPAHGNRFAITSAKYTEPFSDEFEIVNLNGVIPENRVGEICEKLFMRTTEYKKLRYKYTLVTFRLQLQLNNALTVTNSPHGDVKKYVVIMETPENMTITTTQNFAIPGHNKVHLEINSNRNISIVINNGVQGDVNLGSTTGSTTIDVSGSYGIVDELNEIIPYGSLTKKDWGNHGNNMDILDGSSFTASSFSSPIYLNCIFTDPEAIEGGVNGQWGTIGFKFTLTADSQYCWEKKNGFTIITASGATAHTFYDKDMAIIVPPKITIVMKNRTTKHSNESNENKITFSITDSNQSSAEVNIKIPPNDTTTNPQKNYTVSVANDHILRFVIDPVLRQVYGIDENNENDSDHETKTILAYPYTTEGTEAVGSIASTFTGFKTIPKGSVTIDSFSSNIYSIAFGDYFVGYLI